uniref:Uncharacterized protein n=1 Tax=viral metagenome TaxID=1070528 RepID=A0A6C0ARJ8_9ZZZZ
MDIYFVHFSKKPNLPGRKNIRHCIKNFYRVKPKKKFSICYDKFFVFFLKKYLEIFSTIII